jgi:CBS domain-containing protein
MAGSKIKDVMTEGVELIGPDATMKEAAAKMAESDVGILPVGENDRLVGVITDRDLVVRGIAQGNDPARTKVRDVMTQGVLYCYDDQDATQAADDMAEQQVRRMPVVSRDKRLIGMISLGDIARKADADKAGKALREVVAPGNGGGY